MVRGEHAQAEEQRPHLLEQPHEHRWPVRAEDWDAILHCRVCGLVLLRGYFDIANWVVRRVESIEFVDDRTVRRRVSVDYTVPTDAVALRRADGTRVRVLPLALMRRKSIINFDFRDHDGRPMPLPGLRENQALTLGAVRAWAATLLEDQGIAVPEWPQLPRNLGRLLDDVIAGDQEEMTRAYEEIIDPQRTPPAYADERLVAILERLATNFILFATEPAAPGTRRIVKWSYDEPLTLLHSTTSYQGHADGPCPPVDGQARQAVSYGRAGRRQSWWEADPLLAGLGLQPTLIRFPTPGAELAASFHFEITAPPEVSIVKASLLAGQPNLRFCDDPEEDRRRWKVWLAELDKATPSRRQRPRRRPSFDSVGGGDPTVDLHVAEVPYGSLSRAQVELQASPKGWLATAWLAALLATAILLAAFVGRPENGELATLVLVSYAAAMVTVVVRPDPHVMVTRLLSYLRVLAGGSAVLALAGALAVAFLPTGQAHWCLLVAGVLSLLPTVVLSLVWWLARRRLVRDRPPRRGRGEPDHDAGQGASAPDVEHTVPSPPSWQSARRRLREERQSAPLIRLSPWEHYLPSQVHDASVDADFGRRLAKTLDDAEYPYDAAVVHLGFDRSGIKVASLESERTTFYWTHAFEAEFRRALGSGNRRLRGA